MCSKPYRYLALQKVETVLLQELYKNTIVSRIEMILSQDFSFLLLLHDLLISLL